MNSTLSRGIIITIVTIALLLVLVLLRRPSVPPDADADQGREGRGTNQIVVPAEPVRADLPVVAGDAASPAPTPPAKVGLPVVMITSPDGREVAAPPVAQRPGELPEPMANPPGIYGRFNDWSRRYRQADTGAKSGMHAEGLALATQRRNALKALIQSDPEQALLMAVKESIVSGLPSEVAGQLEQHIHQVGKWEFIAYRPASDQAVPPDFKPYRSFVEVKQVRREAFAFGRTRELTQSYEGALISGLAIENVMAVAEVLPPETSKR